MAQVNANIEEIFAQAIELPAGEVRAAWLNVACGSNDELKQRVERLLRAHDDAPDFMEAPGIDLMSAIVPSLAACHGSQIGPYKLLEQIGEGGMGVVYLAEQPEPVRRKVALKIIKPGTDTRKVIARFESERTALSLMDSPNIARVLDAGTTSTGHPYFVMELVHGQSITQFCDQRRLSPRERLALFLPVCQAIQHAHQKGLFTGISSRRMCW